MKLHTNLSRVDIYEALYAAKRKGRVTPDIEFVVMDIAGSRTHRTAYEIQLGTYDKDSLPEGTRDQHGKKMRVRRFKNSGHSGAGNVYSATWDEWGWFMREVFDREFDSRFGGLGKTAWGYKDVDDFHEKTDWQFTG